MLIVIAGHAQQASKPNILFIISDDLTTTAIGAYGNPRPVTPHIDKLAKSGVLFERAYCQFPVCGPSRASFLSGYYPTATGTLGYTSGRENIGDKKMLPELFKANGYYTARVSKIFHMAIPSDIEKGTDGTDDPRSWTERFNSQSPEWQSKGAAELVQDNPTGSIERKGGNVMTIVKAEGGDLSQADGKTAAKACELISAHKNEPFFLAVGLVRPHVPFVAPKKDFKSFPFQNISLPLQQPDDWDDIPKRGINYVNSIKNKMDEEDKKKAIAAYYASVHFMDRQVGKILKTLKKEGLEDNTIVVFTSDHGFHLDEHEFWMKVSLKEESARVPLIIKVPGYAPARVGSFAELIDLYPTLTQLAGLKAENKIQGRSLTPALKNPRASIRDTAFSITQPGDIYLLRTRNHAYIQYGKDGQDGIELFDMAADPKQFHNLAKEEAQAATVAKFREALQQKIADIKDNDL
ncbi:sulfatase [Niabella insulamsoli]|uniref:sulfatase n=1 Tax=Niabella insulamsoli TaxID=3144874 RepID=UPI0031FC44B1